jgi:hypothetical protein
VRNKHGGRKRTKARVFSRPILSKESKANNSSNKNQIDIIQERMSPNTVALEKQDAGALNSKGKKAQPVVRKQERMDTSTFIKAASSRTKRARINQKNRSGNTEVIKLNTKPPNFAEYAPAQFSAKEQMITVMSDPNKADRSGAYKAGLLITFKVWIGLINMPENISIQAIGSEALGLLSSGFAASSSGMNRYYILMA